MGLQKAFIIYYSCQNILFTDQGAWVKSQTGTHDITMGSYPGSNICELVGLYMLHKLRQTKIDAILYRDDGAVLSDKTERQIQLEVKKIIYIFRQEQLNIEIKTNIEVLDFLDVTLKTQQYPNLRSCCK